VNLLHVIPARLVCKGLAGFAGLLSALSAMAGSMVLPGGAGIYTVDVTSFREARFKTVYEQQYDYSCGSAALASLLTYHYEDEVSEQAVFREMYELGNQEKIQKQGFSLLDMKRYAENHSYRADGFRISLDKLAEVGVPAITLIKKNGYMHFVLIKGVTDTDVLMGDPSLGVKAIPRREFESMWQGHIMFIIHNEIVTARKSFNSGPEWKVTTRAPLDMALSRESLADFNLMLPARSDF
jgi:predicted double-glycine peptidase